MTPPPRLDSSFASRRQLHRPAIGFLLASIFGWVAPFACGQAKPASPTSKSALSPERESLRQAAQALRDQLPAVAMAKLDRLVAQPNLPPDVLVQARLRLAEAAVRASDWPRALAAVEAAEVRQLPEAQFWKAMALQGSGRLAEAEKVLALLPADESWNLGREVAFNRAAALAALGDSPRALQLLEPWRTGTDAETSVRATLWTADLLMESGDSPGAGATLGTLEGKSMSGTNRASLTYLRAKLLARGGLHAEAAEAFQSLAEQKSGLSLGLNRAAVLGAARSQVAAGDHAAAERTLTEFIQQHPDAPFLHAIFREFIAANVPPDPEMEKLLTAWAASESKPLNGEAALALAAAREAEQKTDEALAIYTAWTQKLSGTPLAARAVILHVRLLIRLNRQREALELLAELKKTTPPAEVLAWISSLEAKASYDVKDFARAAALFESAAAAATDDGRKAQAAYSAALSSLAAGSPAEGMALLDSLAIGQARPLQADLQLERGLYLAGQGSPEGTRYLQQFFDAHRDHPRAFAAGVALAELTLTSNPRRLDGLAAQIAILEPMAQTSEQKQRLELLETHATGALQGPEAFVAKAEAFAAAHPESLHTAQLLMQLGEAHFEAQQYTRAKASFLKLADDYPDSPLAEPALFWAGKAAVGSMAKDCEEEALKLWDRVAQGTGPLRFKARLEQGLLDQRRDPPAAVQIFDNLLKSSPPPDAETRFAALCLKGETILAHEFANPQRLQEAISCFDSVIQSNAASLQWKQQAFVRKGAALESLEQDTAALEAYYEAMTLLQGARDAGEVDYHWFFRAGEKAMRLLESKSDWKGAVAVGDRLSEAPGPQAEAARQRTNRLRTEHFLWNVE